jgi:hypothetical protein
MQPFVWTYTIYEKREGKSITQSKRGKTNLSCGKDASDWALVNTYTT